MLWLATRGSLCQAVARGPYFPIEHAWAMRERPKHAAPSKTKTKPQQIASGRIRAARKRRNAKSTNDEPSVRRPKTMTPLPMAFKPVRQIMPTDNKMTAILTDGSPREADNWRDSLAAIERISSGVGVASGSSSLNSKPRAHNHRSFAAIERISSGVGVASGSSPLNSKPQAHDHRPRGASREHSGHRFTGDGQKRLTVRGEARTAAELPPPPCSVCVGLFVPVEKASVGGCDSCRNHGPPHW